MHANVITMRKRNLVILGDYSYYLYKSNEMKNARRDCAIQISHFSYRVSSIFDLSEMYTIDKQVLNVAPCLGLNETRKNNDGA